MTVEDLRIALDAMNEEDFKAFTERYGGKYRKREQIVWHYVQGPNHEQVLAEMLGLQTEEDKRTALLISNARWGRRSGWAAIAAALVSLVSLLITRDGMNRTIEASHDGVRASIESSRQSSRL